MKAAALGALADCQSVQSCSYDLKLFLCACLRPGCSNQTSIVEANKRGSYRANFALQDSPDLFCTVSFGQGLAVQQAYGAPVRGPSLMT